MRNRCFMESRVSVFAFAFVVFLSFFPGSILSAVVTLKSVKLYDTHTLIENKPRVFFQCADENKILLPDVEEDGILYSFKGEESWQPLTMLETEKCKKCGIYEDLSPSDHALYEWDLCSSNFTAAEGHCTISKEGVIMATFVCQECSSLRGDPLRRSMKSEKSDGEKSHILPTMITIVIAILAIAASVALYKWWQKRKRQRDQARFMRLFDEDDDLDDELGLREMF